MLLNQVTRIAGRGTRRCSTASKVMRTSEVPKPFPIRLKSSSSLCSKKFSTAALVDEEDKWQKPQVIDGGEAVRIFFSNNDQNNDDDNWAGASESKFHAPWLWYSDPTFIHSSSGQRLRRLSQFPGWKISSAETMTLRSALQENATKTPKATIPSPPPPPGCLHSIGTVYKTIHHESNNPQIDQTTDTGANSNDNYMYEEKRLLRVTWEQQQKSGKESDDPMISYYDWNWLQRCRYDDQARRERSYRTQLTPQKALGQHPNCPSILEVSYEALFPSNDDNANKDTMFQILDGIAQQGAVLIRDAPLGCFASYNPETPPSAEDDRNAAVGKVGRALGGGALSHGALYGDLFHVVSMPNAANIAYTSVALSPHQDLAYFESKPGLQLLHCIQNRQDQIQGGESVLVDAVAAAECLRKVAPQYFDTLCRCYGTFMKQREGADMMYSRPHIVLGDMDQVVAVHWSPPFEGPPMGVPADQMENYLIAYAAFERMLDDHLFEEGVSCSLLSPDLDRLLRQYAQDYSWERSLEPGDILIFNNERMLHGRRGFNNRTKNDLQHSENLEGGIIHRHLAGCYTNIDDTINTYRTLLRDQPDRANRVVPSFGNGSVGSP